MVDIGNAIWLSKRRIRLLYKNVLYRLSWFVSTNHVPSSTGQKANIMCAAVTIITVAMQACFYDF